jgi:hypothetical protein
MPNNITKLTLTTLRQRAQLGDRGRAILALAGPILTSLLMSINQERADDAKNGRTGILLCQLAYFLKTDDDGALGDAFEYAAHQSIRACDRGVVDPLFGVLMVNGVRDDTIDSIFFARDKQGDVVLMVARVPSRRSCRTSTGVGIEKVPHLVAGLAAAGYLVISRPSSQLSQDLELIERVIRGFEAIH